MVQVVNKMKSYYIVCKTATDLFHIHGIRKVNVEELCDKAGVSKMTFYRLFKNKAELVRHIIQEDFNENFKKQTEIFESDITFPEKINASILLKRDISRQYSKEFISDLYSSKDTELVKIIHQFGDKGRTYFKQFLMKAQQDGYLKKDLKVEFFMYYLEQIQQKLIDQNLIDMFDTVKDLTLALTNMFFYGILEKK